MSRNRLARLAAIFTLLSFIATVHAEQPPKVDQHGDPLPPGAIARLGTVRWRHGDGAIFVAFLPGGKALLTVGRDETVRKWDVATGKERRRFRLREENATSGGGQTPAGLPRPAGFGFAGPASSIALSADGKTLAYSSTVPPVRLFDVVTGRELRTIKTMRGGAGVVFAPDGKTLAVQDVTGPIRLYEVATGKELIELAQDSQTIGRSRPLTRTSTVFSPDGKVLVTGSTRHRPDEQAIIFWDTTTGKALRGITGVANEAGLVAATFSPDGKVLAWIKGNGAIALADPTTGKEIRQLMHGGKEGWVVRRAFGSLLFAPDGKTLAAIDIYAQGIPIWDVETGKELRTLAPTSSSRSIGVRTALAGRAAFSPDGKLLALGGEGARRLVDVATGKMVNTGGAMAPIVQLSYARDGKTVLAADGFGEVIAWTAGDSKELRRIPAKRTTNDIALSGDGRHFVSRNVEGAIFIHDAIAGTEARSSAELAGVSGALAISPDNKLAAFPMLNEETGMIAVYDLVAGKELHRLQPPVGEADPDGTNLGIPLGVPTSFSFSPDGQILAMPFDSDKLVLWNISTGTELCRIQMPRHPTIKNVLPILGFAFSSDNRSLLIEFGPDGLGLWETATGKERRQYGTTPRAGNPRPEDERLARLRFVAGRYRTAARALALSPDGRLLAQRRPSGVIQLWDVGAAKELGRLAGHQADVTALAFAGDSKSLASGSGDTTILIRDVKEFAASAKPQATEVDAAARWNDLLDNDAAQAFDAIYALTAAPDQAVPFLKERLRPAAVDTDKIQRLIADLDDERFAVRKQASAELEKIGEPAAPSLRKALEGGPSLEARRRIEDLLAKIGKAMPHGEAL